MENTDVVDADTADVHFRDNVCNYAIRILLFTPVFFLKQVKTSSVKRKKEKKKGNSIKTSMQVKTNTKNRPVCADFFAKLNFN